MNRNIEHQLARVLKLVSEQERKKNRTLERRTLVLISAIFFLKYLVALQGTAITQG